MQTDSSGTAIHCADPGHKAHNQHLTPPKALETGAASVPSPTLSSIPAFTLEPPASYSPWFSLRMVSQ